MKASSLNGSARQRSMGGPGPRAVEVSRIVSQNSLKQIKKIT